MATISLLSNLILDNRGILSSKTSDEPVFLRQGDMDGACGPYCLSIGLIIKGYTTYSDILNSETLDKRTRLGKLFNAFLEYGAFVRDGTFVSDLKKLAEIMRANSKISKETGQKIVKFAEDHLDNDCPVIFGINGKKEDGLSHWVLLIGKSQDTFFALDPGYELKSSCYWNCALTFQPTATRFGYKYHKVDGGSYDVEFAEALALT